MIPKDKVRDVIGSTLYGANNEKIGKVGQVYLDTETDQPQFATVRTGFFGTRESFVPLDRADARDGEVHVPHGAQQIQEAPSVETEQGQLSRREEQQLYEHYGMGSGQAGTQPGETTQPQSPAAGTQPGVGTETGTQTGTGAAAGAGAGTAAGAAAGSAGSGATGGESGGPESRDEQGQDTAMTRSEERLQVGKESRETGRARLRKYVVTENVERTVPVSHEEVRVEREPITEENRDSAHQGSAFTESEHEEILYEERPVVSKEEVPVERVRLTKETQTEEERVSDEVRKEQIEEDVPGEQRGRHEGPSR